MTPTRVDDIPAPGEPQAGAERLVDRLADFLARVSADGQILFVSRQGAEWLGYGEHCFKKGDDLASLVAPEDQPRLGQALARALAEGRQALTLRLIRHDGAWITATCRVLTLVATGRHAELLFAGWDAGGPLPADGDRTGAPPPDPLTGLPSRGLLLRRLAELTRPDQPLGSDFALMHLDLDGFQKVNDALGHGMGDRLLVETASRLTSQLRASDLVVRSGSDDFVLILAGPHDQDGVAQVARKLLAGIQRPYRLEERHLHLTASIGVALCPEHGRDGEQLLKYADIALASAKAGGRNRWQLYRAGGGERAHREVSLEERMYDAIQHGEFEMYYQPICRARSREMVRVEALMRWHRPGEGFVSPAEFIPLAERNGLIAFLGAWSLRASCHQAAAWSRSWGRSMQVSVNLSPAQFGHGDVVTLVRNALAESGLPADCLSLEITEGTLMRDAEESEGLLGRLRELGVGISVDDFGTGYSSLAYLKRFPLSSLKIDRSFVAELERDGNDMAIVSVIAGLARELGLDVVAEGVETEAQLRILADKGCAYVQGYLLGRPVSAQELSGKVASGEWKVGQ